MSQIKALLMNVCFELQNKQFSGNISFSMKFDKRKFSDFFSFFNEVKG